MFKNQHCRRNLVIIHIILFLQGMKWLKSFFSLFLPPFFNFLKYQKAWRDDLLGVLKNCRTTCVRSRGKFTEKAKKKPTSFVMLSWYIYRALSSLYFYLLESCARLRVFGPYMFRLSKVVHSLTLGFIVSTWQFSL